MTTAHQEPAPRAAPPFEAGSWKVPSCEYVEHLRTALGCLIDLSDYSRRAVERILIAHGCGDLDVSRLLSGRFDLKVHQLIDVCQAIGVHPMELFRLVLKEPRVPSSLVERMTALFGGDSPQPGLRVLGSVDGTPQLQALEQRVDTLQQQLDELRRRPSVMPKKDHQHEPPPPVGHRTSGLGENLEELAELVRELRIMAASNPIARGGGPDTQPSPPGRANRPGFGEIVAQLDNSVRKLRVMAGLSTLTPGAPPGRRT